MSERQQLEETIAALEAQRRILGDAVVDTALIPLREKLASLEIQPVAEQRKLVTVLFADLVGFTTLAEHLDPEDVREIINGYFSQWTAAIESFGGTVEKFIGDAVMAVFGLAMAREEDPENAVRAALKMREALDTYNRELEHSRGLRLEMRVGIHTGPVVVSFLRERKGQDFVIVGDTVNTASRLQSMAPSGGILVSHDTYRHIRGIFDVQALHRVQVKGKKDPVEVYLVLRLKPRAFRMTSRGVEGIETRMVGREAELKRLQDLLYAAVEDSERQMVTLAGEAGMGKSRLLAEFDNWIELLPHVIRYFKGRATSPMQNLPYSLLRDVFSFRFEIQESDPVEVVRRKMEQGIAEVYSSEWMETEPAERPGIESGRDAVQAAGIESAHFISHLLGFEIGESPYLRHVRTNSVQLRDKAFSYLVQYFKRLAERRPIVMLLEDLHWADDSSLDLINHLAQALADNRLLIVGTTRPRLFERRPYWGEGLPFHTRIDLRPLSRRDSRVLVGEILQRVDGIPAGLRDLIVNNAEGNPFYIEELIKMLVEDGVILKGEERWSVDVTRLEEVRVPPTLTGVIQARFDSLRPEEKMLLQRASVIGRIFWDAAVDFISQQEPAALDIASEPTPALMNRMRSREMIYQREKSAFEDTSEYLFKHAILRDVMYETVLKRDRRIYHAHAARWLVQITQRSQRADEYAALIGEHWDLAGEVALAAEWYGRAGRHAARHYANAEALRCLSRALELTAPGERETRCALLLEREKVYDLLGDRHAQAQDLEALAEIVAEDERGQAELNPQQAVHRAEVALRQANFAAVTGDFAWSEEIAQAAIRAARQAQASDLEASSYLRWGIALWQRGQYARAKAPLERALELAEATGLSYLQAEVSRNLGVVLEAEGDTSGARRCFERALELMREIGDRRGESRALNSLGVMSFSEGDYDTAAEIYERALQLKRELGDRMGMSVVLSNLGSVSFYRGNYQAVNEYYQQVVELAREMDNPEGEGVALIGLGQSAIFHGQYDRAQGYLQEAEKIFLVTNDTQGMSETKSYLSMIHHHRGEYEAAYRYAQEALDLAEVTGTWGDIVQALTCSGHVLMALRNDGEAMAAYQRALELPRPEVQPDALMDAIAGLARAFLSQGRQAEALAAVEEILVHVQTRALQGTQEPFRIYLTCYEVLRAVNDPRASHILQQAYERLQAYAAKLDPAQQQTFLEVPPVNYALMKAFQQRLADSPTISAS